MRRLRYVVHLVVTSFFGAPSDAKIWIERIFGDWRVVGIMIEPAVTSSARTVFRPDSTCLSELASPSTRFPLVWSMMFVAPVMDAEKTTFPGVPWSWPSMRTTSESIGSI